MTLASAADREATGRGVPRPLVIGWLAVFAGFEWLQARTGDFTGIAALGQTSIIELIEVAVLVRLFTFVDRQTRLSGGEALATVAGLALAVLVIGSMPINNAWIPAATAIALYGFVRFGRGPGERAFVAALVLFIVQYAFGYGPFIWLHSLVGQVDAAAVRGLLSAAGYAVGGSGSLIVAPPGDFVVDVNYGCSSTFVLARVVPAFFIVVLGLRGTVRARDCAYVAALAALTVAVNLLRLMPVALSPEGYAFWHEGLGAAMLSALYAALILAAALAATRAGRMPARA